MYVVHIGRVLWSYCGVGGGDNEEDRVSGGYHWGIEGLL